MWAPSLGQEDLLEEGIATHSGILAWKIPGQRSLAGYSPWGHKELDKTEQLNICVCVYIYTHTHTHTHIYIYFLGLN